MILLLVQIMLGFAALCFVVSEITKNYSQVDKLWSLTPIVYAWVATAGAGFEPRMVLVATLISLWGARLTWNFSRQGGYSIKPWDGHEDYRWAHVRAHPLLAGSAWRFRLFNLGFISFYQHALLLLITLPIVFMQDGGPLGPADGLLALLFVLLVLIETVADNQQWAYQSEKYRRIRAGESLDPPYDRGFVNGGLWAWCRHPNYFAEQSIWVVVYAFSVIASGWNWSVVGCVLLILLFQGSSRLSEGISAEKYPSYAEYQRQVPRFLPRRPARA